MTFSKLSVNTFRLAFLAAIIAAVNGGAFAQKFAPEGNKQLVGVWDVMVTIRSCADGSPIATFPSMAKFEEGGTMTNQDVGNIRTPVPGIWSFTGPDTFDFAFKAFTYNAGVYSGYLIVRHDVTMALGGNEYESEGSVTVYDPAGTVLNVGCSSAVGVRFQ